MTDVILEINQLNTYYKEKGNARKQICKDISFQMEQGEILGLVGESGSGKTTLVKALLGMVKDTEGKIAIHTGRPQMVFQDPYSSLNPSKKIGWLLKEPLVVQGGMKKKEIEERAREMLKKVGLEEHLFYHYPRELSGGQRQRVAIAIALMQRPGLLIADEPVSALDVTIQAQIIKLLLSLKEEMGLSILFISHDLRVVYQMCDRVLIMQEGEIVEQGKVEEVYKNPKHPYTKMLLQAVTSQV